MEKTKPTTTSQSRQKSQLDPHAAALSQVEHDTAGQQERIHRQVVREGQEKASEPEASKNASSFFKPIRSASMGDLQLDTPLAPKTSQVSKSGRQSRKPNHSEAERIANDSLRQDDPADKVARDTARYEALAREHEADLSEEGFNEVLQKLRLSR